MRHFKSKKAKALLAVSLFATAAVFTGCGATSNSAIIPSSTVVTPAVTTPTVSTGTVGSIECPAGSISIAGSACIPGTLDYVCAIQGGQMTTAQGVSVCEVNLYFNYAQGSGYVLAGPSGNVSGQFSEQFTGTIPELHPSAASTSNTTLVQGSDAAGLDAFNTGIPVLPGDTVTFAGNGGWGSSNPSSKTYLGFFNVVSYSPNCTQFNLSGNTGKSLPLNTDNDLPAGLYATDGTNVFQLDNQVRGTVLSAGTLKIGFNVPLNINLNAACATLNITKLYVTRCQDVNGSTYVCQ
jgi:hypothetical protein